MHKKEFLTISNTPERTGHSSLYHTPQYSHFIFLLEIFSTALYWERRNEKKMQKKNCLKYRTKDSQNEKRKEIIFISLPVPVRKWDKWRTKKINSKLCVNIAGIQWYINWIMFFFICFIEIHSMNVKSIKCNLAWLIVYEKKLLKFFIPLARTMMDMRRYLCGNVN